MDQYHHIQLSKELLGKHLAHLPDAKKLLKELKEYEVAEFSMKELGSGLCVPSAMLYSIPAPVYSTVADVDKYFGMELFKSEGTMPIGTCCGPGPTADSVTVEIGDVTKKLNKSTVEMLDESLLLIETFKDFYNPHGFVSTIPSFFKLTYGPCPPKTPAQRNLQLCKEAKRLEAAFPLCIETNRGRLAQLMSLAAGCFHRSVMNLAVHNRMVIRPF